MTPGGGMGCFGERTGAFCFEDSLIIAEKNMEIARQQTALADLRDKIVPKLLAACEAAIAENDEPGAPDSIPLLREAIAEARGES